MDIYVLVFYGLEVDDLSCCNNGMYNQHGGYLTHLNSPEQHGRCFADVIFRCIFLNENICILIRISMKFVPKCPIDNNPALV